VAGSPAAAAATAVPLARVDVRAALARLALPLAVAALAVGAAAPGAVSHALYGDEVASARIVTEPGPREVLRHVRRTESTPPAWYLVAWGARKATDADVASLRLLSVLFAAAASALTAIWALRLLASRAAAALAGSLVALGSLPAEYAEQLRAYALVVLVSVAFGMLLAEAAHRPRGRWPLALGTATWLGTLTHYFFFFVAVAAVAWLWAARPRPPAAGASDDRDRRGSRGVPALAPELPRAAGSRPLSLDRPVRRGAGRHAAGRAVLRAGRRLLRACPPHGHRCFARGSDRCLVASGGSERGRRARPDPDRRGRSRLGSRAADLRRAQHAASGALPGNPRRGGGDGVACAPRPRRGGHGHRRRAVRCRVCAGDARPRRLRLGRASPQRSRLECPRAAHRRLPDRCREPAWGRDPDHLRGVLVPPRSAGARMGAGPTELPRPVSRSCSRPIRVGGTRATAAA
jgi:hypothetical protein